MQKKSNLEKQFHSQGHGEYREIHEEDFLKEVRGRAWGSRRRGGTRPPAR